MTESEDAWMVGQLMQDELPVVYSIVQEAPAPEIRARYPWLTVIAWTYDGGSTNGMPSVAENDRMLALELAIDAIATTGEYRHAYRRTGCGLKEFAYYIADRDRFMLAFNDAVRSHPRYPIDINFYEDREWSDHRTVRELFAES